MEKTLTLPQFVNRLQGSGCYTICRDDIPQAGRSQVSIEAASRRLKKKSRLVCPRRGFFAITPLEYQSSGSPPISWFI